MTAPLRPSLAMTVWLVILTGCSAAGAIQPQISATPPTDTQIPAASTSEAIEEQQVTETPFSPILEEASDQPTNVPTATATQPPAPKLYQLTTGGCCVEPFWSSDGKRILYIDRPGQDMPSGLWGIDLQGSEPQFITDRLGVYSPDMQLRAFPQNGATFVEDLSTGELWQIPNGGRAVSFSPDKTRLAWTAGQPGPPFDTAQREVWISGVDGRQAQRVFSATRAGFEGWLADGRLLISGLIEGPSKEQGLWILNPEQAQSGDPSLIEMGRGNRIRNVSVSPNGIWVAYLVTFSADPGQDGLWIVEADTGEGSRVEVFGGYQWRDDQHLLVVPLELNQPAHRLLQIETDSNQIQAITDPEVTPFKITNGDWSVSPSGDKIAFVSSEDRNIWILELPE